MNPPYELYRKAMLRWGVELQLDMVVEECAELQQAIIKLKRKSWSEESIEALAEEFADVKIMLEQLELMLSEKGSQFVMRVHAHRTEKLARLEKMLR